MEKIDLNKENEELKSIFTTKREISHAFVTGTTGLLGNNLVRALVNRGIKVTGLVRNIKNAKKQFSDLEITFVEGNLNNPDSYKEALKACDGLFHTAAYFKEAYKGGENHWSKLYNTNVTGTINLMTAAKKAGIKNMIHTSSIAVLKAEKNQLIDETMLRDKDDKEINDYYRSKILSDEAVKKFLNENPDIFCCFVLPGFMFGPGDMGPTSSGQLVMDYVNKKIPGIIPSSYSVVDARDVAEHEIMAMEKGKKGELYLAAGKFMTMKELLEELSKVTGIPAPKRVIPLSFLKILAVFNELISKLTKKETLINKATIHVIKNDYMRNNFSHKKSKKELGCEFRSLDETLKDVINWYKENGYL